MADIVLDRVSKVFGTEVVAVNDVSLEIGDGEFQVTEGNHACDLRRSPGRSRHPSHSRPSRLDGR